MDVLLKRNRASKGQSFEMNDNAYMMDEAQLMMTPKVVKDIREIPYTQFNSLWQVLEISDGFGSHISSLCALEIQEAAKNLSVKEEVNSSHMNQAYDNLIAKQDKESATSTLLILWRSSFLKGPMDQYALIHVGIAGVHANTYGTW